MENSIILKKNNLIKSESHFIRHFLNMKASKSRYTAISYERDIKDFFGVERIEDIRLEDIIAVNIIHTENYILAMKESGKSSATINRKLSSLSSLYKWLLKYRDNLTDTYIIKYNPFGDLKEEKPKVNNKDTDFLTKEECCKLLESFDENEIVDLRNKSLLSLALTTALRKSEIINIKIGDIYKYGQYDVISVIRKGNKKDLVKLQAPVKMLIDKYIYNTNRTYEEHKDTYLFIGHSRNKNNNEKLDSSTLNYMIKNTCKRVGIEKNIKVHSTRHTAITLAILSGASIEKVRDFAAHRNIATTNRYVHSIDKLENNAGDLIDIF